MSKLTDAIRRKLPHNEQTANFVRTLDIQEAITDSLSAEYLSQLSPESVMDWVEDYDSVNDIKGGFVRSYVLYQSPPESEPEYESRARYHLDIYFHTDPLEPNFDAALIDKLRTKQQAGEISADFKISDTQEEGPSAAVVMLEATSPEELAKGLNTVLSRENKIDLSRFRSGSSPV